MSKTNQFNRDEFYTLWQCVGARWVVERTYRGSYLQDALGDGIRASFSTTRPYGVFQKGQDPNDGVPSIELPEPLPMAS